MMTAQITHKVTADPTLTPAQQKVIQDQIAKVDAAMNDAWAKVQQAANNSTLFKFGSAVMNLENKLGGTSDSEQGSLVGSAVVAYKSAQSNLAKTQDYGKAIINIASVPLSADPNRARLKQAIDDYRKEGTAFISQAQATVKAINNTTLAGILTSVSTTLAEAITAMLNAIGDAVLNGIKAGLTSLSLSGVLVIAGIAWLLFSSNSFAAGARNAGKHAAGAIL